MSTPKLTIAYAFIITIFWGTLICFELLKNKFDCCLSLVWIVSIFITITITLILSRIIGNYFQSYIDEMEDLKI